MNDQRRVNGPRGWRQNLGMAAVGLLLVATPSSGQSEAELSQLSIESLMNVEVTSVSRRAQRLADSAASVYVLTADDIRRSGASTIPDVLRLVPGLHVGQLDSNKWSVSARGFSGRFANKLLVLVDGRSVYTPLFSGVFWNLVSVSLDEIERIEVIRGPGATLWGANAVNGVVNIVTRSSTSTQGGAVMVGTGSEDRGVTTLRYGGRLGTRATFRADAGGILRDGMPAAAAPVPGRVPPTEVDTWRQGHAGLRVDWQPNTAHELTVIGDLARSRAHEAWFMSVPTAPFQTLVDEPADYATGFVLGRLTRHLGPGSTTVQAVVERSSVEEPVFAERRNTVDLDAQHTTPIGRRHRLVGGVTYRRSADDTTGTDVLSLTPSARALRLWSTFVQDEVTIASTASVTVGGKFEHNDFTGLEAQPNVRLLVRPTTRSTLWGAASRAVRLPSRVAVDGRVRGGVLPPSAAVPLPQVLTVLHDSSPAEPDRMTAYESGYRWQPAATLGFDVSGFFNRYETLLTTRVGTPSLALTPRPMVAVPVWFRHDGHAHIGGGELAAQWRALDRLFLAGGYSRTTVFETNTSSQSIGPPGDYPEHQAHLRGALSLSRQVEVDAASRYVGRLPLSQIPAYVTADARVAFRAGHAEISFIGRNLLGRRHQEFRPDVIQTATTAVERSIGTRLRWSF